MRKREAVARMKLANRVNRPNEAAGDKESDPTRRAVRHMFTRTSGNRDAARLITEALAEGREETGQPGRCPAAVAEPIERLIGALPAR